MAVNDLEILQGELPEVFDLDRCTIEDWDENWIFIPIIAPTENLPEDVKLPEGANSPSHTDWTAPGESVAGPSPYCPEILHGGFPGSPITAWTSPVPPPDALAFYLPFHYFYPTWWGIYLTVEGTLDLAQFIWREARGWLSPDLS